MFHSPPTTRTGSRRAGRTGRAPAWLALGLAIAALAFASATPARADDAAAAFDLSQRAAELEAVDDGWRARGMAHVDLPLGLRARFDASYSDYVYSSDLLSQSFLALAQVGPKIVGDRTIESRIAVSRALAPGIELEIAWESRNNLAVSDPMGFGRQTIGALIRISP